MSGFEKIIGHTQEIAHLENAIKQHKISHAYIFAGEKGCGKKLLAQEFAKILQCREENAPCGKCHSCLQAESGNHPDIIRVTHEKPATITVEEIREMVGDVQIKPYSGPYKIYIMPDAEKMNVQAQNALLKTIEEPPAYAVILLLTTNASMLLPTILSRCVQIDMKPVADDQVRKYLMEHLQIPDYQADICVAFAQGNIGKAVELASSETFQDIKNAALNLAMHIPDMEISEINQNVKAVSAFKLDIQDYLDLLAIWYRDAMYFKATKDINGCVFKDHINYIVDQTSKASYEGLGNIMDALQKAKVRLNANVNFDLTMELLFLTIKENLE